MAKCDRPRYPPSYPHRHNHPSFSSSLLDSIYRSIDDSDSNTPKTQPPHAAYKTKPFPTPPLHRTRDHADDCRFFFSDTTTSSDYPRPLLIRSDHIRTGNNTKEKKVPYNGGSIRTRIRDLRKSTPGSPGSRLSAFVNMLFAAAGGSPKKVKSVFSYSRSGKREADRLAPVRVGVLDNHEGRDIAGIEEMEDRESVSSSELFELESMAVVGRFADELPVFATTCLGNTRAAAVSRGFQL